MNEKTNNPPSPIEFARETIDGVNKWLSENPVIQTEDQAREAKVWSDRAKEALKDVEAERVTLTAPLNERLNSINDTYKALHSIDKRRPGTFDRVVTMLRARIEAYLAEQEAIRQRTAAEAARIAADAERLAREAESREREAISNAAVGEVGVDLAAATQSADTAFAAYEKAAHQADIAERDQKVRLGGGFQRATALRTKEILTVEDPIAAVTAMWPSEKINEAILSCARALRQEMGELPPGVTARYERGL